MHEFLENILTYMPKSHELAHMVKDATKTMKRIIISLHPFPGVEYDCHFFQPKNVMFFVIFMQTLYPKLTHIILDFYLRGFSESRSSSGSTHSVCLSVRNTLGVPSLCNL